MENHHPTQHYWVTSTFMRERTSFLLTSFGYRTIKTILDALKEELEPEGELPTTPIAAPPGSPLAALRRLRFSLSPLFFIESNLLKVLAPECTDSRDMTVRAGTGWKAALRLKIADSQQLEDAPPGERKSQPPSGNSTSQHDPTYILVAQRADIISTWKSPQIQEILERRRPRLRHSPGLYVIIHTWRCSVGRADLYVIFCC
jgi:hypothetical protein